VINFFVDGQPIPQGSMKVINGHVIHSQGSALASWRSSIALAAKMAGAKPHLEPVEIEMIFTMARPRTVTRPEPSVAPDLDKLVRAVLDGLTAIAYRDDGQVTTLTASKIYGKRAGVSVKVGPKLPQNLL
jgi:Holliday junction resolvase RusA-like endonuclease